MPNEDKRRERLELAHRLRSRRQFLHPTILPFMSSVMLYFLIFVIGSLFHLRYPEWVQYVLVLLVTLSIGISGLIILIRGEFIEKNGQVKRGWYAYSIGILFILFGFGVTLSGIYNFLIK